MTWGWSRSTAEPLLGLVDAHKAQPGKQEAEQHQCAAAAQLVAHIRLLEVEKLAKTHTIAMDILEAAKISVKLFYMNAASSEWSAVVPAERQHSVLQGEVLGHLKRLCEGSGMENVQHEFWYEEPQWHLRFALSRAVIEAPVAGSDAGLIIMH